MRKRMKKVSALILAVSLLCSAFVLPEVYAAVGVKKPEKGCSLQVNCGVQIKVTDNKDKTDVLREPYNPIYSEVVSDKVEVKVNIYKVADIQVTGKYKPVAQFSGLTELENVSYITKAKDWQDFAAAAKNIVDNSKIQPTKTGLTKNGSITFTGLEMGMYLIDAQQLLTAEYRYEFTPYLISLPNNYFYETENDDWDYELVDKDAVGLKPQQFNRYGYLVIDKKLADYNVTNPSAVFVFEVAAKKAGELVFNDVVAIDFAGVGSDSVKVGPIVAGAEVTVKEVYQGAGYEQVSVQPEGSQIIVANTYWDDCDDYREASKKSMESLPVVDKTVTLQNKTFVKYTFTNQHNDVPNGGTGVVNTFTVEETATEGKFIWDASQEFQGQTSVESEKTQ